MKNNRFYLPVILITVLFIALMSCMLVQIYVPGVILPTLNIPNIVLLSVVSLLLEHFIFKNNFGCFMSTLIFGISAFAVLPLMAGFVCIHEFWKLGLIGGVVFALTSFLFTSAAKRLKTGPKAPAALILTGFGIYLASQCFSGILL